MSRTHSKIPFSTDYAKAVEEKRIQNKLTKVLTITQKIRCILIDVGAVIMEREYETIEDLFRFTGGEREEYEALKKELESLEGDK